MKNYPTVESREPGVEDKTILAPPIFRPQPSTLDLRHAFTLVELLTVISIIALLAAFTVAVLGGAKKSATLNHAKAELAQLETAIDSYKQDHGFYPPSNANNYLVNQLYYELAGTTNNTSSSFQTLDGSSTIPTATVSGTFGVGGFMNCAKGSGEESVPAKNYLIGLPSTQIGSYSGAAGVASNLVTSVGGSDQNYLNGLQALGFSGNPWRYNSSNPTNNPGAYDLWVQIVTKPGQTNLICNWTKQVQINSPLP